MENFGAVEDITSLSSGYASMFKISPNVLQIVREIESNQDSQETPDIIEQIKSRVKANPWTAWRIIVFITLSLLIPFVNNLLGLIEKIF